MCIVFDINSNISTISLIYQDKCGRGNMHILRLCNNQYGGMGLVGNKEKYKCVVRNA